MYGQRQYSCNRIAQAPFQGSGPNPKSGPPYRLITKEGEVKAVLLSNDEWESWQETLEIMSDKNLMKGIQEGLRDIQQGHLHTFDKVFGHEQGKNRKR